MSQIRHFRKRQKIVAPEALRVLPLATAELLAQVAEAPIAFFADLLVAIKARSAQSVLPKYAEDLKALVTDAKRARRDLEDHLRQHKPPAGEIVQTALTLWHERTVATASHLNE